MRLHADVQLPENCTESTVYMVSLTRAHSSAEPQQEGKSDIRVSFIALAYLLWQRTSVFLEGLGGRGGGRGAMNPAPPPTARTVAGQCVCEARQSITADTHKAHFMSIREAAVCVCVSVCVCVCVRVLPWV